MISFNNLGNLGRLANQMFQYASLKGIARNRGFDFCIPPEASFGQYDQLVRQDKFNLYNVFDIDSKNNVQIQQNPVLQERMHEFDEELYRSCPENADLYGYYQSPRYFEHIKDEIKLDFTFSREVRDSCNEMYESIHGGKKVLALHIRRTDYTTNPNHPVQPLSYYEKAIKMFDKNVQLLIFSDDTAWCQEQELFSDEKILLSEGNDVDMDLCLMSLCDYHIIANSSFSWWGAWLADSEQIVAPINWFAGETLHKSVADMSFGNWSWL